MTDEEIRNVALIFSQLSRAIERNEKIEIEYLDKNGEIKNFNRDLNCTIVSYVANISTLGYVNLTEPLVAMLGFLFHQFPIFFCDLNFLSVFLFSLSHLFHSHSYGE